TGHLEGALLLDITAGELEAALPRLDPAATYLVYCRSGNRAGAAVELMRAAGFTDVTNLGSVDDAARATGLAARRLVGGRGGGSRAPRACRRVWVHSGTKISEMTVQARALTGAGVGWFTTV